MKTASRFSHLYLSYPSSYTLILFPLLTCDCFCPIPNEIMYTITWGTFFIRAQVSCSSLEKALSKIQLRNKSSTFGTFLFFLSRVDPSLEMNRFHTVSYENIMDSNYSSYKEVHRISPSGKPSCS